MSAGEIAGLIAAGALVLLVVVAAVPLLKLGRTLDESTLTIRQAREQSAPILSQASTTVAHVNTNLERVEDITGNAANASSNVAALTSVVAATVGGPLVKAAAFSYGVRQAVKGRREGGLPTPPPATGGRRARRGRSAGALMRRLFWLGWASRSVRWSYAASRPRPRETDAQPASPVQSRTALRPTSRRRSATFAADVRDRRCPSAKRNCAPAWAWTASCPGAKP